MACENLVGVACDGDSVWSEYLGSRKLIHHASSCVGGMGVGCWSPQGRVEGLPLLQSSPTHIKENTNPAKVSLTSMGTLTSVLKQCFSKSLIL